MTIDYSKWDNIDTDSEPEYEVPLPPAFVPASAATQRPAPAPTTTPVAATPAASAASSSATATAATATPTPAPDSDSEYIQAVTVVCDGEKGFPAWYPTRVAADHLVFLWPASPVPELIGIPLVCHCVGTISERLPDLDNQKITYINIDPESGFAPPLWQSGVGTVIVARKDKKALLPQHFEGVWMYCDYILDLFGEGQGAPRWLYNRPAFEGWWGRYCQRQKQHRDEFQDVRSPYEM